jgi:hypothetical protein
MNKLLVFSLLMVCNFICCLALAIISPFFPPFAHHHGISEDVVGIIFSANPLGAIIASLILGKILTEVHYFTIREQPIQVHDIGAYSLGLWPVHVRADEIRDLVDLDHCNWHRSSLDKRICSNHFLKLGHIVLHDSAVRVYSDSVSRIDRAKVIYC